MSTNEENRVPVYTNNEQPTIPRFVTRNTPVESLNLNWREKDLPERERTKHVHRLHPYLGKYIPQLVEIFLRKYFSSGQIVADPFVGSGTTLVQANELGINSIGYDVSLFNVILCRAKTTQYNLDKLQKEVLDILRKTTVRNQNTDLMLPLFKDEHHISTPKFIEDEYLKLWFAETSLQQLTTYRDLIGSGEYEYTDLLQVILSRAARSARLTTHFDLDFPKQPQTEPYWCYKHSRICYPTAEALKFLNRYSHDTLKRIKEYATLRKQASVSVYHQDSREADLEYIDGVITSPPYVGLIDYHEQHAYAYHLLGLQDKSQLEIGAAQDGTSQKAKEQYKKGIAEVFSRMLTVMPSGGRLIVVANDKAGLYPQIANSLGVEVDYVVNRHVNRRTGRRSGEFYESIFIWRKP